MLSASKPHILLTEESPEPELIVERELGGQFPSRIVALGLVDVVHKVTVGVPDVVVGFVVVVGFAGRHVVEFVGHVVRFDAHVVVCVGHVVGFDAHVVGCVAHVVGFDAHVVGCVAHVVGFDAHGFGFDAHAVGFDAHVVCENSADDEQVLKDVVRK